ncbi:MAG: gephyrin-like molybdotransferase Glp, partial [Ancrocorticia populi]
MLKEVCRHYADVVGLAVPTPATQIPLADARGLVLSEDVAARFAIPPFTNSAMDGFAVRAADVAPGVPLQIEADIAAGSHSELPLTPGSAQRIMTGAPLPDGADAILQVELTEDAANNMLPAAPESVTPTATLAAGT